MSGRDQKPGPIGKIKEMIRTVSESVSTANVLIFFVQKIRILKNFLVLKII